MKKTAIASCFGLLMGLATLAHAAAPAPGTYLSTDLGGTVLTGRGSQSWSQPNNAANGLGDVFNSQSWDGSVLGGQWRFECGVSNSVQSVVNTINGSGNGYIRFTTDFAGGTFWLSKNGPWGDAVNDLTGTISNTTSTVTVTYIAFNPVQARGDVTTSGYFDGSGCSLTYNVSNTVGLGDTDGGAFPANFPALLDTSCGATRANGSWGTVGDVAMRIDCVVPAQSTTWSGVKTLYR